jgi:transposase InsO family protein
MDTAQPVVSLAQVLEELKAHGILLTTDPKLPSVCAMVAGEPVRGSWWAHPRSHEMFRVLMELAAHPDVLVAKLVSGKDTFIHRALWPAVLAIGTAREKWQTQRLDEKSRALLAEVEKSGEVQARGKSALRLEQALLVHGVQVHTDAGSHEKILMSWGRWAKRSRVKSADLTQAKASLEKLVEYLNRRHGGRGRLPWR